MTAQIIRINTNSLSPMKYRPKPNSATAQNSSTARTEAPGRGDKCQADGGPPDQEIRIAAREHDAGHHRAAPGNAQLRVVALAQVLEHSHPHEDEKRAPRQADPDAHRRQRQEPPHPKDQQHHKGKLDEPVAHGHQRPGEPAGCATPS